MFVINLIHREVYKELNLACEMVNFHRQLDTTTWDENLNEGLSIGLAMAYLLIWADSAHCGSIIP